MVGLDGRLKLLDTQRSGVTHGVMADAGRFGAVRPRAAEELEGLEHEGEVSLDLVGKAIQHPPAGFVRVEERKGLLLTEPRVEQLNRALGPGHRNHVALARTRVHRTRGLELLRSHLNERGFGVCPFLWRRREHPCNA
eukprot:1159095-Rhodomonas_salina.1